MARGRVVAAALALGLAGSCAHDWSRFEPRDGAAGDATASDAASDAAPDAASDARDVAADDGPSPACGMADQPCCAASPACAAGLGCQAGVCRACPAGQTLCAGACVDTTSSSQHCGGCGRPCAMNRMCRSGTCQR